MVVQEGNVTQLTSKQLPMLMPITKCQAGNHVRLDYKEKVVFSKTRYLKRSTYDDYYPYAHLRSNKTRARETIIT